MRYSELFGKSLKDVLENECEAVEQRIHTDECGNIKSIEIKYLPKDNIKYTKPVDNRVLWD